MTSSEKEFKKCLELLDKIEETVVSINVDRYHAKVLMMSTDELECEWLSTTLGTSHEFDNIVQNHGRSRIEDMLLDAYEVRQFSKMQVI